MKAQLALAGLISLLSVLVTEYAVAQSPPDPPGFTQWYCSRTPYNPRPELYFRGELRPFKEFEICLPLEHAYLWNDSPLPGGRNVVQIEGSTILMGVNVGAVSEFPPSNTSIGTFYARFFIPALPPGRYVVTYRQNNNFFAWPGSPPFPIIRTFELDLLEPVAVFSSNAFGRMFLALAVVGLASVGLRRWGR